MAARVKRSLSPQLDSDIWPTLTIRVCRSREIFKVVGTKFFTLEGQVLTKVGRSSGRTEGEVSDTCVDVNKNNSSFSLLCQDLVQAVALPGDSGAPVFSWSSASLPPGASPQARLHGIL